MQAMILAAGFGTRLLPHTRLLPKPLFPILNEPLLLLTIRRLQRCGFDHIIVNCHHLRERIVAACQDLPGVLIQEEESILGTGGGLRRALPLMKNEPLLVTNGDIYHTIDYQAVFADHVRGKRAVTLAMHDCPRFNSVQVSENRVAGFGGTGEGYQMLAFTGLSVIEPSVLEPIVDDRESCIIDRLRQALAGGVCIGVHRVDGCFWTDMGTPLDYLTLHRGLLTGIIPRWREFGERADGPLLVAPGARLLGNCQLDEWCALGAVEGRDLQLSGCVVWDGVRLPDGFTAHERLISSTPDCP